MKKTMAAKVKGATDCAKGPGSPTQPVSPVQEAESWSSPERRDEKLGRECDVGDPRVARSNPAQSPERGIYSVFLLGSGVSSRGSFSSSTRIKARPFWSSMTGPNNSINSLTVKAAIFLAVSRAWPVALSFSICILSNFSSTVPLTMNLVTKVSDSCPMRDTRPKAFNISPFSWMKR